MTMNAIRSKSLYVDSIESSDFKIRCLRLVDEVARTGRTLVVTKHGKPLAELRPYRNRRSASPIGLHRHQITVRDSLLDPLNAEWNVGIKRHDARK